ncbi:MAG: hypothetical protein SV108_02725 [Pseudomonadota bacterium]|nr:hypothetical protein [Pseudomonadota bacterium]HJO36617.1 hypothetical protein [Gammaproteobacteria bacterium]
MKNKIAMLGALALLPFAAQAELNPMSAQELSAVNGQGWEVQFGTEVLVEAMSVTEFYGAVVPEAVQVSISERLAARDIDLATRIADRRADVLTLAEAVIADIQSEIDGNPLLGFLLQDYLPISVQYVD